MFRAFSVAAAAAAFVLAVLGSWVRINGAGLTCPDWPLCRGALVPTLSEGVVLEWSHRFVASILGFLILGAMVTGWRRRREISQAGATVIAIAVIFLVQVVLGAATVRLANSPDSVVLHWVAGMLLVGALVRLAVLAVIEPQRGGGWRTEPFTIALAAVAGLAFVTMGIGAYVSSSGAGIACPTIPDCYGSYTGTTIPETAQMIHRIAAAVLFVGATIAVYWSVLVASLRVRVAVLATFALLMVQIMLGLANVAWNLPTLLREAHAANATAVLVSSVCALCLALLDEARQPASVRLSRATAETS